MKHADQVIQIAKYEEDPGWGMRHLRMLIKHNNKLMGQQGRTIYELRCRVAELLDMVSKEHRGYYRRLETMVQARDSELVVLRGEIDRLREKLEGKKDES